MKRPMIVSLGEVLWDLLPAGEQFGGAPANLACHAALQNVDVTMVSVVGDDRHGREATEILSGYGIDVSLIQIASDAPTGTVEVRLDDNGQPTFTIHEGSAWDQLAWNEALASRLTKADAVCFGTLGQRNQVSQTTIRRAINAAKVSGIPRVLDINLRTPFFDDKLIRESVQLASILKLSDEELVEVCLAFGITTIREPTTPEQAEPAMGQLLERGDLDMVVMTRGSKGAVLVTADNTIKQNGVPAQVIDTIGAGDAFTAAFVIGELRGVPHEQNLKRACEIAAAACTHSGAVPNPPKNQSSPK